MSTSGYVKLGNGSTDSAGANPDVVVVQVTNGALNTTGSGGGGGSSIQDGAAFTRGTTNETTAGGVVSAASPTLTAGTAGALSLDTSGNLRVNVVTGGGSGGTSLTDGATFTRGTTAETPVGGSVAASNPTLTAGTAGALSLDTSGNLRVIAANSISAGTAGVPSSQVLSVQSAALTPYHLVSAATTNATNVTAAAGLCGISQAINNSASAWAYLKIFDKATAPAPGTDTPVLSFGLPPNGGSIGPLEFKVANGLGFAITGAPADNDTTAVLANQVIVNLTHS